MLRNRRRDGDDQVSRTHQGQATSEAVANHRCRAVAPGEIHRRIHIFNDSLVQLAWMLTMAPEIDSKCRHACLREPCEEPECLLLRVAMTMDHSGAANDVLRFKQKTRDHLTIRRSELFDPPEDAHTLPSPTLTERTTVRTEIRRAQDPAPAHPAA